MSLTRLSYLVGIAEKFDEVATTNPFYKMVANAIDMAVTESAITAGLSDTDPYIQALEQVAIYATMLDLDGHTKEAQVLDVVLKTAAELWPSAHDRDEKYDAKSHNAESLFQSLKDQPKVESSVEPVLETMKGEALHLLTRHSPDYPGVPLMRVSDGVYQDTMTRKVYDFNHGWVGEHGQHYPGGSVAQQTPHASHYLGFQQVFESSNFRSRPRTADLENGMVKTAQARADAFYQHDPRSGRYRGILEYIDDDGGIFFLPEKPVISKDINQIKNYLENVAARAREGLAPLVVNHKGASSPWHAESNMPFDVKGNRVD